MKLLEIISYLDPHLKIEVSREPTPKGKVFLSVSEYKLTTKVTLHEASLEQLVDVLSKELKRIKE